MKTILLTGKTGQIGWELQRTLAPLGKVIAFGRQELDLADPDAIRKTVNEIKPSVIVNAAGYTGVDKAENEPEVAMRVNGHAPGVLAEEAKKLDALLVHYSTDYVFDGNKTTPYAEEDAPNPLNAYGRSKLAGEQAIQAVGGAHLIFRTSWVYGARGHNFLLTILRLAHERPELRVVNDQFGAPTWSRMIAEATASGIAQITRSGIPAGSAIQEVSGIYHVTAAGETSWYGFAVAVLEQGPTLPKSRPTVVPIATTEYPLPARRPRYSLMSSTKLAATFGLAMPDWKTQLALCMEEIS